MAETSKELLDQSPKSSLFEGLVSDLNESAPKSQKKKNSASGLEKGRPLTTEVPKSQVLGKVKDFLGVMAKANEQLGSQGTAREDYDIEVLQGSEQEYIEMDLILGVADLHTPEAIAAAEAAMGGSQPAVASISSSSCSETEDDSDEDNDSGNAHIHLKKSDSGDQKLNVSNLADKPNKRPKIVVLN